MANETEPSIAAPVSSAASASSTLLLSPTTMTATTTAVVSTLTASPMQQESQNSFPPSLFSLGHGTDYESDCNRDHHDRESQVVPIVRILFIIVLVASMACTATAVYQTMTKAETDTFHLSFVSDSNDVIESVGETLYTSLGAVDSYLVSLVSMARSTNQSWPYVSMPDASVRLAKLRSLSKAFSVMQAHFVTLDEKATWENYTTLHQDWAYDAIRIQATDPNYHGKVHDTVIHKPYIRNHLGNATGPGPFLPTWHTSPYVPGTAPYNVDTMAYSNFVAELPELVQAQRVVICKSNSIANASDPASVAEAQAATKFWSAIVGPNDDPSEPISWIVVPIVDDMANHIAYNASSSLSTNHSAGKRNVVGVILLLVFWRDLIQNILPDDTNGIIVVFSNACGQAFSYEVNGRSTTYLGPTDRHDPAFNDMGKSIGFDKLVNKSTTGQQYTGLPLGDGSCPYTLSVYPSAEREEHFTSHQPVIFTACALLIFAFTSVVFILYDTCVQRRQHKNLIAAAESRANVSLLERMVSDRTRSLREANQRLQEANQRLEEANQRVTKAYQAQLEHFACMSHEIRTPLNCVVGLSSLLLDTKLDAMQEEYIRMIVTSSDLLLTVVNDVLDFAKVESGNVDIVATKSNLQHLMSTVVQSIEEKARPKKLRVRTVLDPLVGEFMHVDCRRLQQILYNLLGNAVKFSHDGGTIQLSVVLLDESVTATECSAEHGASYSAEIFRSDSVVVHENGVTGDCPDSCKRRNSFTISSIRGSDASSATYDRRIRFTVRDCGKGIERRDFEAIFQPFRQANAETERVYGGTGLGLAVTSRLVTNMGGTIAVDSRLGEWSEFSVDLPYTDSPVDIMTLASRLEATSVVLIDDDLDTVRDMSDAFRRFSLELSCYATMAEMVASLRIASVPSQSVICLVNERLYDRKWGQDLTDAGCIFLSHGPNYTVKESKGHYRSLTSLLPCVLMESLHSALHSVAQSPRRRSMMETPAEMIRILIVEDNVANQRILLKILDRLLYKNVDVVDDGQQACDREATIHYDVILMGIQIPIMNGVDACKEILGRARSHPKPKVIFITHYASDGYKAACREVGGVDFLPMSASINDVDDCLQRNMPQRALTLSCVAGDVECVDESQTLTSPAAAALSKLSESHPSATTTRLHATTITPSCTDPPAVESVKEAFQSDSLLHTPAAVVAQIQPAPTDQTRKLRILVAEDNKINQKVLLRILQRLHYTNVDVVDDGQQACDREKLDAYDVILMDIQMPVMDGIAACREILGRPSIHVKKPKIIFVTAHALETVEADCRAAGGIDFITKPVDLAGLDQCLRRHTYSPTE